MHKMRFGSFMAPFHAPTENPTLALERDLDLVEWMDQLGYDEVWFGEHHSAGFEILSSPELFVAAAAQRTRRIKLGTGVISLAYQHPFMVADKVNQLDHMLRGRFILGCGPGALPSDAIMMGVPVSELRPRMEQSLEAIIHLLTSDEPLTMKTAWFELNEARLQLSPYTYPRPEIAVAAVASPSGPRCAGRFGIGMLSVSAASEAGFKALGHHRKVWQDRAEEFGQPFLPEQWRLVAPMHLAHTRKEAKAEVEYGIHKWADYFTNTILNSSLPSVNHPSKLVDAINASGMGVIGTPDDAAELIEKMVEQSGGFGTFLLLGTDWANREATWRSHELFARDVMPRFQASTYRLKASQTWSSANMDNFMGQSADAMKLALQQHKSEYPNLEKGRS